VSDRDRERRERRERELELELEQVERDLEALEPAAAGRPARRERDIDHRLPDGAWHIVRAAKDRARGRQPNYWRRPADVPLWFFLLDRWGLGAVLAALAWLGLRALARVLGLDL
jgi:hypothetical protein